MRKRLRRCSTTTLTPCGSSAARLPFWLADCGRRSAARKAAACADASGLRLANFSPTALPYGSLGKPRARTLHSTALIPAHNSITRRQTRTGGNTHSNDSPRTNPPDLKIGLERTPWHRIRPSLRTTQAHHETNPNNREKEGLNANSRQGITAAGGAIRIRNKKARENPE
jgi:hypothetical protein